MVQHLTAHARFDRIARIDYILNTVGDFGTPIAHVINKANNTDSAITDKAIKIISNLKTHDIITMYIPSASQLRGFYKDLTGSSKVPDSVWRQYKKIEKYYKGQPI